MKKIILGLVALNSISAFAGLPQTKAIKVTGVDQINELLANPHSELRSPDCIKNILSDSHMVSRVSQGEKISKVVVYYNYSESGTFINVDPYNQNGIFMGSGANCQLK